MAALPGKIVAMSPRITAGIIAHMFIRAVKRLLSFFDQNIFDLQLASIKIKSYIQCNAITEDL
ncbi:hypothetical protein DD509_04650 [Dehalogenimonas alkenigignens]|nr:hypothetical protein DD509_04650 [Dehalogenimonas alkenigignens]